MAAAAGVTVHQAAAEAHRDGPGVGQLAEKEEHPQVRAVRGVLRLGDKRDEGGEWVLEQEEEVERREHSERKLTEQMQVQEFQEEE